MRRLHCAYNFHKVCLPSSSCISIINSNAATRDLGGEKLPHAVTNDVSRGLARPSSSKIVINQPTPNPLSDSSHHVVSSISECPPPEILIELTTSKEECSCSMEKGCSVMGGIILFLLACGCCCCLSAATGRWALPPPHRYFWL